MCLKKVSKNAASVYDGYKKKNPLMMRKKMAIKDVVFRKNEPDCEVLRFELAWDTELYVLLAAMVLLLIIVGCKICKWFK